VRRVCQGRLGSLDCPPSLRRQASEGRGGAGRRVTGLGKEGQKSNKGPKGAGGRQTRQLWWKLQDNYYILNYFINKQMRTMTKRLEGTFVSDSTTLLSFLPYRHKHMRVCISRGWTEAASCVLCTGGSGYSISHFVSPLGPFTDLPGLILCPLFFKFFFPFGVLKVMKPVPPGQSAFPLFPLRVNT